MREIRLRFDQNGRAIEAGSGAVFGLLACDGLSATEYETESVATPHLPGDSVTAHRVLPRYISATMDCNAEDRDWVLRFFRPKEEGELTVRLNGIRRRIRYMVDGFRALPENVHQELMTFKVRLRCAEPYFMHEDDFGQDIAAITPFEMFPDVWETGAGWFADLRQHDTSAPVDNRGDVPIGLRLEFHARGFARDPFASVREQRLEVFTEMQRGDVLAIDTRPRRKGVWLNGASLMHRVCRNSAFLQAAPGRNPLLYGAAEGLQLLEVRLFFTPLYLGV